jgi:putative two-component system response regulator
MMDLKGAHILIVDDQQSNVLLLERLLEREGYTQIASTTRSDEVVGLFETSPPDLLLLDLQMPDPDGLAVMELVQRWTEGETYVPILVLTADAGAETRRRALAAGARDFLAKPLDAIEVCLRIENLLRTRQLQLELQVQNDALEERVRYRTWELERSRLEAFQKLALAAEYRDDETRDHTQRVGRIAALLAAKLGFAPDMVQVIGEVAPLHDLGKIGIPDTILLKPGKLTDEEFEAMKQHAQIGADIMAGSSSPLFEIAADIALTHHERWDGSGYPRGLAGQAIALPGRIVALADAFDAMSHDRPYKKAMPREAVIDEIDRCSGSHFDPSVVDAFHALDHDTLLNPTVHTPRAAITGTAWEALREISDQTANGSTAAMDALLEAAFDNTPVAALIVDDNRRYVAANTAACQLLGVSLDELCQMRIDDFAPLDARPQMDMTWKQFMQDGVQNAEFALLLPGGSTLDISYRGMAHFLPGRHLSLIEPLTRRSHLARSSAAP